MTEQSAKLTLGQKDADLAVRSGSIGPDVVDVTALYKQTGLFTYDPGFSSTASCESKITYIDGDEGVLLHRGYPIDQLAERGDFLETCYLLLYGELPTTREKDDFVYRVTRHTMVHEQMSRFYTGFRRDAHPMAVMVGSVGALSAFYHDSTDIADPHQTDTQFKVQGFERPGGRRCHGIAHRVNLIRGAGKTCAIATKQERVI